ncbi:hypothetical protein WG78_08740 [Amantichitinum ursilacus]|uniref:Uncharacterized protein n=1 Tax=Amantichitinum ursilacus TaxID=857265 RepID=A0A0N0GP53_9NEIS|nr:hypothetical protein WG78_08740 [Amantichitinum ursilacus]
MSFALYVLLDSFAPVMSNETLEQGLKRAFHTDNRFSIEVDRLPFVNRDTLILRWDSWSSRISYEEGDYVKEDSIEIAKVLKERLNNPERFDRRIRLVFNNDPEREYTNEMILIQDYFRVIPGSVIVDVQQNEIVRYGS